MAKKITGKRIAGNVAISLAAQLISTLVGILLHLIIPKYVDELQFSHLQSFALYTAYVGLLHFGLLDGLLLRYAHYDFEELDKARLRSQFRILLVGTFVMTAVMTTITLLACTDATQTVFILVAFAITTKNLFTYTSYVCQITNRISRYATIVILQKAVYGLIVVVLLCLRVQPFYWYAIAELTGDLFGIFIGGILNRGIYIGKSIRIAEAMRECWTNVKNGILLTLIVWTSGFLVNGAKMIVQWRWGDLIFGKVSLSFSVTNMFLAFVAAVSVVLFPSLKRIDENKLHDTYQNIRSVFMPLLFFMLLFYFPGRCLLDLWLPKYSDGFVYLGMMLPIIVFSSKTNLITDNYLKVYRKEHGMLCVNLLTIGLGAVVFPLCAFVFDNLEALVLSVVPITMLNSILSELIVGKILGIRLWKEFVGEAVMCAGFILIVMLLEEWFWIGFAAYFGLFLIYCLLHYRSVMELLRRAFRPKKSS